MNPSWMHLGHLFQTPLYHGSAQLAERLHPYRRERAAVKMRFPPCYKINDLRHCQIIRFGAALPCAACLRQAGMEPLIQSAFFKVMHGVVTLTRPWRARVYL